MNEFPYQSCYTSIMIVWLSYCFACFFSVNGPCEKSCVGTEKSMPNLFCTFMMLSKDKCEIKCLGQIIVYLTSITLFGHILVVR